MNKISTIIINYDTPEMTAKAIKALFGSEAASLLETIVIDNGSEKKFTPEMAREKGVRLILNPENRGFAKAANQGIQMAKGEYILLLNSDTLLEKDCLGRMLSYLERHPHTGLVGPLLVYPDGKKQISSGRIPDLFGELLTASGLYKVLPGGYFNTNFSKIKRVDWLSGGCLLVRKKVFEEIGPLDENFFFGVEDIDLGLRAQKAGWPAAYYPLARAVHFHGFSSGGRRSAGRIGQEIKSYDYFFRKHFPEKIITRALFLSVRKAKQRIFNLLGWK